MSESYLNKLPPLIHTAIQTLLKLPERGIPRIVGTRDIIYEHVFQQTKVIVLNSGKGQWIYDKLFFELKDVSANVSRRLRDLAFEDDVMYWLDEFVAAAQWFDGSVRLLETMLTYLDRIFIPRKPELHSVR